MHHNLRPTAHGPFCHTERRTIQRSCSHRYANTKNTNLYDYKGLSFPSPEILSYAEVLREYQQGQNDTSHQHSNMEDQALKKTTFARDLLHFCHHARQAVENELGKRRELPPRSQNLTLGRVPEREYSAPGGIPRQESNRSRFSHQSFCRQCPKSNTAASVFIYSCIYEEVRESSTTHAALHKVSPKYIYLATRWTNLTRICLQIVGHLISLSCLHPTSVREERTTFSSDIQVVCITFWLWLATLHHLELE